MPFYDYRCPKCGHEMEEFNDMKDRNKQKCPKCQTLMARRYDGCGSYVEVWGPKTLRHVEHDPKTFRNKRELREYCKEHKISSGALL